MKVETLLKTLLEPQFLMIMAFYAIITFIVGPFVGGYLFGRRGIGHGYVVGGVLSLILWHFYGRNIVRM